MERLTDLVRRSLVFERKAPHFSLSSRRVERPGGDYAFRTLRQTLPAPRCLLLGSTEPLRGLSLLTPS
ncbi:hypothetical protein MPC1_950007 [Methylocella tundrae]|nr:hypothetical protein MPC1_950007 [Methylocella tundrae]